LALSLAIALAAAGCSVFGAKERLEPTATASTGQSAEQVDVRRLLGPDYCPELRILGGAEVLRRYESGHEDDPASVIWQASFGNTARECLYNPDGSLTLRVGVSGRVIAGPKGAAGEVPVPFKIAIVKYRESVLATEAYTVTVAVPPTGSSTFTEVHEINVPSPGSDRDYIIYVGFEVGEWDLEGGVANVAPIEPPTPPPAVVEEEPDIVDEPPQVAAEPQPAPSQPNVLPTPSSGFVLP
jgi:hypothetical protein